MANYIKKITLPASVTGGTAATYDIKALAVNTTADTTNTLYLLGVSATTGENSTLVKIDSGISVKNGTITGSLSGNASSATKLGSADVGSGTKPMYLAAGVPTASSSTVGGGANPVYLNAGTITASNSTIGGAKQLIYMNAGTLTASAGNEGGATQPVYLKDGVLTACTSYANATVKSAGSADVATKLGSADVGSTSLPIYLNAGVPTAISYIPLSLLGTGSDTLLFTGTASGNEQVGTIRTKYLPSYVDDVVEVYAVKNASTGAITLYSDSAHTTAITGERSKIYADVTTDAGVTYRYTGSKFVEIGDALNADYVSHTHSYVKATGATLKFKIGSAAQTSGTVTPTGSIGDAAKTNKTVAANSFEADPFSSKDATTVVTSIGGGSAASWSASVTDEVLTFTWTANVLPTVQDTASVIGVNAQLATHNHGFTGNAITATATLSTENASTGTPQ